MNEWAFMAEVLGRGCLFSVSLLFKLEIFEVWEWSYGCLLSLGLVSGRSDSCGGSSGPG